MFGSTAPQLVATDDHMKEWRLPKQGSAMLIWFGPVFGKFGCKPCQTSLLHERYPDLRKAGIEALCATFDSHDVNRQRNAKYVWRVPILTVTPEQAAAWQALRKPTDSWVAHMPSTVAYLLDPSGYVVAEWRRPEPKKFIDDVLKTAGLAYV
jgi:peroxiredoxin